MRSNPHPALVFAVIFIAIFLLHVPLLQLPYFWDEAGYYVPAARDLLLSGSLIPHTTVSNAHPPLVMAWVALWWKLGGFAPLVTRSAMLVVAAFSLLGLFRLAQRVANVEVAVASTVCTALYPVFFAQSSLAQVDLAAAGLTFWGLLAYLEDRPFAVAIWFSLAALAKETAILTPVALAGWQLAQLILEQGILPKRGLLSALWDPREGRPSLSWPKWACLISLLPLALWYAYHYAHTGYVFGNPEFFRYNVASTLSPLRFLLALVLRLWQAFGYLHLWLLTLAMLVAMFLPPLRDGEEERRKIPIPVQAIFFVVIAAYVVALALIGGAVLARYMLTAVPLGIILAVSTLRRRLRYWKVAVAGDCCCFHPGLVLESSLWILAGRQSGLYRLCSPSPRCRAISRSPVSHGPRSYCVARIRRTGAPLDRLRDAAGTGRAYRGFLAGASPLRRGFPLAFRSRAGVLDQIRTRTPAARQSEKMDRPEAPFLWLSPRPAASGGRTNPWRTHCVFGGAKRPMGGSD